MKRIAAALALAPLALAMPTPASALPRNADAFAEQIDICRTGLEMIMDGATDDEELAMFNRRLRANDWLEESDLDDLLVLCSFYKSGYLNGLPE
jgi:hypothetical protein